MYLRRTPQLVELVDRDRILCASPVVFDQRGIPADDAARCQEECERILESHPDVAVARFLLAVAHWTQGRADRALEETDRLLQRRDDLAYVHRLRQEIFQAAGDEERARQEAAAAERLEE